jgi:hypothetical protein
MAARKKPAKRTASPKRPRRQPAHTRINKPADWLFFLEPLVRQMAATLEILRRLRWAVELSKRGLSEAPGPLPGWRNRYKPKLTTGFVENVLMPEEMVASLTLLELQKLQSEWESEVAQWAQGIWDRRGDTLRLREKRRLYREGIETLRSGPVRFSDPSISDAAAARLVNQLRAEPGKWVRLRSGAQWMHAHAFLDPFGNALPTEVEWRMLKETEEERAKPPLDDRALRRLVRGAHKKSLGGVHDIDPRLLRPKK